MVIVFGFSKDYYKYIDKDASQDIVPNPLFVGAFSTTNAAQAEAQDCAAGWNIKSSIPTLASAHLWSCPHAAGLTRASEFLFVVGEADTQSCMAFLRNVPAPGHRGAATDPAAAKGARSKSSSPLVQHAAAGGQRWGASQSSHLEFVALAQKPYRDEAATQQPRKVSVTRLLEHLPANVLSEARDMLNVVDATRTLRNVEIPIKARPALGFCGSQVSHIMRNPPKACGTAWRDDLFTQVDAPGGRKEAVAEVNGVALPAMFEARFRPQCSIQRRTVAELERALLSAQETGAVLGSGGTPLLQAWLQEARTPLLPDDPGFCEAALRLTLLYNFVSNGFASKKVQIEKVDWLTPAMAADCFLTLQEHLPPLAALKSGAVEFEVAMAEWVFQPPAGRGLSLSGAADAVFTPPSRRGRLAAEAPTIYEFKVVSELDDEHLLQAVLYEHLWHQAGGRQGDPRLVLLNLRSGGALQLCCGKETAAQVAALLCDAFLRPTPELSDDAFLLQCRERASAAFGQRLGRGGGGERKRQPLPRRALAG